MRVLMVLEAGTVVVMMTVVRVVVVRFMFVVVWFLTNPFAVLLLLFVGLADLLTFSSMFRWHGCGEFLHHQLLSQATNVHCFGVGFPLE